MSGVREGGHGGNGGRGDEGDGEGMMASYRTAAGGGSSGGSHGGHGATAVAAPGSPSGGHSHGSGSSGGPCGSVCGDAERQAVVFNVGMNIFSSVAIVNVNKLLVTYGFKFILLLTGCHFLAGYAFLAAASSTAVLAKPLFVRPAGIPARELWAIAAAGIASIALMNYSLKANSVGTYQVMKVAVLPATMTLSYLQGLGRPSRQEVIAAIAVVFGALVCTASDVRVTLTGILIGCAAVLATAQYQIWQGTIQSRNGMNSTQAMYLMSPPQAIMTFTAAILFETNWGARFGGNGGEDAHLRGGGDAAVAAAPSPVGDDIWSHNYAGGEVGVIAITCLLAVLLNYSTIAVIGKVRPVPAC